MAISATDFDFLRQFVLKESSIVLEPGKEYLVESRLAPLVRREGLPSAAALVERLRSMTANGLHSKVVEAMTTNETLFFRDLHPFETLRTVVLPELMLHREQERRLNIFFAACSSGQEPYSVAMLLREHFPKLSNWSIRLIGCDLSREMLERAKAGRYSQLEISRGLPTTYLLKYFKRLGTEWEIDESIRRMVEFIPVNLSACWPVLPVFDIIFMRNVLIYFDVDTRKQILARARCQMKRDGLLTLGGAETTLNIDESFERYAPGKAVWYRLRA